MVVLKICALEEFTDEAISWLSLELDSENRDDFVLMLQVDAHKSPARSAKLAVDPIRIVSGPL